jgi:hypothetical protein
MFIDSPELYDAIYHFKDYARECDRLRSLINEVVPARAPSSMLRAAPARTRNSSSTTMRSMASTSTRAICALRG